MKNGLAGDGLAASSTSYWQPSRTPSTSKANADSLAVSPRAARSAAICQFADAYNKAGGQWVDNAVAGADQGAPRRSTALSAAIHPRPAQSLRRSSFHDLIDQDSLNNVDDVAA